MRGCDVLILAVVVVSAAALIWCAVSFDEDGEEMAEAQQIEK